MLDYLRNLTKSADEKRQEQITAYVDGELSPRERQRFEQLLADDAALQQEVADLQQFKQNLRQLPRRRVPRNFTLDPAAYQAPQRQPLLQLYPAMRVATVLTAVFLIMAVSADLLTFGGAANEPTFSAAPIAMESADDAAMDTAAEAEFVEEMAVEAEIVEQESLALEAAESANLAEETPAEEEAEPELEMAVEEEAEVMEAEEMVEEAPPEEPVPAPEQVAKGTPVVIEGQTLTEDSAAMDDGDAESAAGAEAPQAAIAPTPSPMGTATADTPRIQPTTTVPDRGIETEEEATEIAMEPMATVVIEPDVVEEQELVEETAVPVLVTERPRTAPISGLRVIQIALALLLVVLGTAVWYTRRQL